MSGLLVFGVCFDEMNEHPIGTILEAQKACQTRVWIYSVGIINTIRNVDPKSRRDEETNGTGSLGRWGNHHFILTANHVIPPTRDTVRLTIILAALR